jgi:hypothetical protein
MQVVKWPSHVFRVFAIANFLLAGIGLLFLASSALAVRAGTIGNTSVHPYLLWAFWTMVVTNFILLALLILGGTRLLQLKAQGVIVCNVVFVAEFVYFMALGFSLGCRFPSFHERCRCHRRIVPLNLARRRLKATSQTAEPL